MASVEEQIATLNNNVSSADIPAELKERITVRLSQLLTLTASSTFLPEFDNIQRYIDWILSLPWNKRTQDTLDLNKAKEILDKHHYGLSEIKGRILEYLSVMKLKQEKGEGEDVLRAPILCFVGLVGTRENHYCQLNCRSYGTRFCQNSIWRNGGPLGP
jgi:ATP-dependent Lon protease